MVLSFMTDLKDGRYLWAGHIHSILQAMVGRYVVSGCQVTVGTGLKLNVSSGTIYYESAYYSVNATSVTLSQNVSGHVRADLIVWNANTEQIEVLEGSEYWSDANGEYAIAPQPNEEHVPLAVVIVRDGATSILSDDVYDVRVGVGYATNRLINLAFDDTRVSSTGTGEVEVKTFRFAKTDKYMNVVKLYVIASLWTSLGGFARLRVYIDGTKYLELTTNSSIEVPVYGEIDVSGLSVGMHSVSIRILNDGADKTTYTEYLNVLGEV